MGAGKGSSTSTTTSGPPTAVQNSYYNLMNQAQQVASVPYTPYTGQQVANFTPSQQTAFNTVDQAQGAAQPYINQAAQYGTLGAAPITGQEIAGYENPYQQQVIGATLGNINYMDAQQQAQLEGNSLGSGGLFNDREGVAQANLSYNQDLANNQTLAGLNAQNYQQALAAAQAQQAAYGQAAYTFGNLGQENLSTILQGAQAQLGTGATQQQQAQAELNVPYQTWLQEQAFPYQQTGWLAGVETGVGSNLGGTSTTVGTPAPPNPYSTALGLGTIGASLYSPQKTSWRGGEVKGYDGGGGVPGAPYGGSSGPMAGIGPTPYSMAMTYIPAGQQITHGSGPPKAGGAGSEKSAGQQQQPDMMKQMTDLAKTIGTARKGASNPFQTNAGGAGTSAASDPTAVSSAGSPGASTATGPGSGTLGPGAADDTFGGVDTAGSGVGDLSSAGTFGAATDSIADAGLGAGAADLGADAGIGAVADAGIGADIADAAPLLLFARRGGRIRGFDLGGAADIGDDAPTADLGSIGPPVDIPWGDNGMPPSRDGGLGDMPHVALSQDANTGSDLGAPAPFVRKVQESEGFQPKASWDYKQYTNGYGTRARSPGEVIDEPEAQRRFADEFSQAANVVDRVNPNLDPGSRSALASLTLNAGAGWTNAGLGQAVRNGDMDTARKLFTQYVNAGGQPLPGLINRRQQEASWFGHDDPPDSGTLGAAVPGTHAMGFAPTGASGAPGGGDLGSARASSAPAEDRHGLFGLSKNANDALMAAGFALMGNRSPYLGVAVGNAGLTGLGTYQAEEKSRKAEILSRENMDLKVKQLERALEEARQQHQETSRIQDERERANRAREEQALRTRSDAESKPIRIGGTQEAPIYGVRDLKNPGKFLDPITLKPVEPAGSVSGEDTPGLSGEDFLKTIPNESDRTIVKGLADYSINPNSLSIKGGHREQLIGQAKQYDPTFDQINYPVRAQTFKEFTTGGQNSPAARITSGNTAIKHLDEMGQAVEDLKAQPGITAAIGSAGVPWLSSAASALHNSMVRGTPEGVPLAKLETARQHAIEELTKFYSGSAGSAGEREAAIHRINGASSIEELRSAIAQEARLMRDNVNTMQSRFQTGMHPSQWAHAADIVGPQFPIMQKEAQEAYDRIIARERGATPRAAAPPTAGPAAPRPQTGGIPTFATPADVAAAVAAGTLHKGDHFISADGKNRMVP